MTDEEKDNWRRVHYRMGEEGFDYCFKSYSRWEEIKDEQFHKLRQAYLDSAEALRSYINEKEKQSED